MALLLELTSTLTPIATGFHGTGWERRGMQIPRNPWKHWLSGIICAAMGLQEIHGAFLITRRSEVQVLPPQPSWVTKIDTLTWNPWEIRGFSVFMPCFFKACFIDTQGHFRALGRTWTKFSADLACFMVGFTLSDTFYCSSFLNNLKLFI